LPNEWITTFSLFNNSGSPATVDSGDANAVELGVKIRSDVNGFISGLRFYKSAANTGTHMASLWSSTGTLLGVVAASLVEIGPTVVQRLDFYSL
jgi:hypothetical protein